MTLRPAIVAQFRQPRGVLGHAAGWVMANRRSNRERNRWTVELLDIQADDRVLEIGCGPGLALQACAPHLRDGVVVGLDHSRVMLDQAMRRNKKAIAEGRVRLLPGGLPACLELPDRFDKVFSVNVVQFLGDREQAFGILMRITSPGGLVASTYQPRHTNATRDDALRMARQIGDAMRNTGFIGISCKELPLEPVPAVCVMASSPTDG